MFSAFTVNAVTFRKGHLLWHRMRVTEEESVSGRGRGTERKTIEKDERDRNLHVHDAHPLLYEAKHTC